MTKAKNTKTINVDSEALESAVSSWLKSQPATLVGVAKDVTTEKGRQEFSEWYVGIFNKVLTHYKTN